MITTKQKKNKKIPRKKLFSIRNSSFCSKASPLNKKQCFDPAALFSDCTKENFVKSPAKENTDNSKQANLERPQTLECRDSELKHIKQLMVEHPAENEVVGPLLCVGSNHKQRAKEQHTKAKRKRVHIHFHTNMIQNTSTILRIVPL